MDGHANPTEKSVQRINRKTPGLDLVFPVCCSCVNRRKARQIVKWDAPIQRLEKEAERAVAFDKYGEFAMVVSQMNLALAGLDEEQGKLVDAIRYVEKRKATVRNSIGRVMNAMQACPHARYFIRRIEANKAISDPELRTRVMQRDGFRCRRCSTTSNLSIDHIIPVLAGGDDGDGNLQVLCRPCNSRKGTTVTMP